MQSTFEITAVTDRRMQDAASLRALEAFEDNLPVNDIIKKFGEAGILHHMPLTVDSHGRAHLERMVASQGVVAARRIEAAMKRGTGNKHTAPLSADSEFQKYMAMRLQLTEGVQLAAAIKQADLDLVDSYAIFVEATLALFRFQNDAADPVEAHGMSRQDITTYIVAAGKLREEARVALLHASKDLENTSHYVAAFGGGDILLEAQPTASFTSDAWLDDDEEDRGSEQPPATDDNGFPQVWPPVLTQAVFRTTTNSDSRSARLNVRAVRQSAASSGSVSKAAGAAVDRYAEAVEGLISGRTRETELIHASPERRRIAQAAHPVTTAPRMEPGLVFDPVSHAEVMRNTPMSPAAHPTRVMRTFRGKKLVVGTTRDDMRDYLIRRRTARRTATGYGDLTHWSSAEHFHGSIVSGGAGATHLAQSFRGGSLDFGSEAFSITLGTPRAGLVPSLSLPGSPSGSASGRVVGSIPPIPETDEDREERPQVDTATVRTSVSRGGTGMGSTPRRPRSSRTGPSSLLTSMADAAEARNEGLREEATRLGDAPLTEADLVLSKKKRAASRSQEVRVLKVQSALASPVSRRATAARNSVVQHRDGGVKDSYLRMHDHAEADLMRTTVDGATVQAGGLELGAGDMPMGHRLLGEALSRAASCEPAMRRSASPSKRSSPPKGPMAAAAVSAVTEVQQATESILQVAAYASSNEDMAVRAGKVKYVAAADRPPTSSTFGKGIDTWTGVWAQGTALVSTKKEEGVEAPALASPSSGRPTSPGSHRARADRVGGRQASAAAKVGERDEKALKRRAAAGPGGMTHLHRASLSGHAVLDDAICQAVQGVLPVARTGSQDEQASYHYALAGMGHSASASVLRGFIGHAHRHGAVPGTLDQSLPSMPGTPVVALDISKAAVKDKSPRRVRRASAGGTRSGEASGASSVEPALVTEEELLIELFPSFVSTLDVACGPTAPLAGDIRPRLTRLNRALSVYPGLPQDWEGRATLDAWQAAAGALKPSAALPEHMRTALRADLQSCYDTFKAAALSRAAGRRGPDMMSPAIPTDVPPPAAPAAAPFEVGEGVLRDEYDAAWAGQSKAGFVSPRRSIIIKLRAGNRQASPRQAHLPQAVAAAAAAIPEVVVRPIASPPRPTVEYVESGWGGSQAEMGPVGGPLVLGPFGALTSRATGREGPSSSAHARPASRQSKGMGSVPGSASNSNRSLTLSVSSLPAGSSSGRSSAKGGRPGDYGDVNPRLALLDPMTHLEALAAMPLDE